MPVVLGDSSALTISLGTGVLPPVKLVINGASLSAATVWDVTASTGNGFTWKVRGGSGEGSGEQVILVDTIAPINESLTYSLRTDGVVIAQGIITRTYTGTGGDGLALDVIASLDATSVAGVRREGSDTRHGERRYHASVVRGSKFSPLRLDPVAGAGGGSLTVATVGNATTKLRALLDGNAIVVAYHDLSKCRVSGCPVPPAELLYVTDESSVLGVQWDKGERYWSLSYVLQGDPEPSFRAPFQVWDNFDAAALTWDDLDAQAITWDEFDAIIWSEVG